MSAAPRLDPARRRRGWQPNPGYQPEETYGRRIRARLADGRIGRADDGATVKPGWAADTCRWTRTGSPFDIDSYEVIE